MKRLRRAGVTAKIRIEHLPNRSADRYRKKNLLSLMLSIRPYSKKFAGDSDILTCCGSSADRSYEICGGQSGSGAGFLRVLRFPLPIFIPPTAPQSPSSITWGWYKRPVAAAVPSGLSLTPLRIIIQIICRGYVPHNDIGPSPLDGVPYDQNM
jgi:hypothetical protein